MRNVERKEKIGLGMRTIEVSCAVIVREGLILAANRGDTVSNSGVWEFPGGKPLEGEQPQDCVVRRVKEELNVDINVVDKMESFSVDADDSRRFLMHPFFAEVSNGSFELSNHSKIEWFMPMQLMSLAWPETDLPIIDEIVNRIFKNGRLI